MASEFKKNVLNYTSLQFRVPATHFRITSHKQSMRYNGLRADKSWHVGALSALTATDINKRWNWEVDRYIPVTNVAAESWLTLERARVW
jgi:hypothetical protein